MLEEAGIKEAEIFLALTDSDDVNLVACLMADMLAPLTRKIARIRNSDFDAYHKKLSDAAPHIETIINPEIEAIRSIERLMQVPGADEAGELMNGLVKFVGIRIEPDSPMDGMVLSDLPSRLGEATTLVAGVVRDDNFIVPRGNDHISAGDRVYLISEKSHLPGVMAAFGKCIRPLKRVMIVGGGRLAFRLARVLEKKAYQVKIVEAKKERCKYLASRLDKTIVLCGDGSDQSLLEEENIRDMDVVITLTGDEETNILVSLLARRLGTANAITKITKFGYFPLMPAIGIHQIVSPRMSAIDSILQHIRRGKVLSAFSVNGEQAEVMEAVALETSDIVGKPLKTISFPKGALIIGISKGEGDITIPSGDSVVAPGNRVIIISRRKAVPKVEKLLSVKLEFF